LEISNHTLAESSLLENNARCLTEFRIGAASAVFLDRAVHPRKCRLRIYVRNLQRIGRLHEEIPSRRKSRIVVGRENQVTRQILERLLFLGEAEEDLLTALGPSRIEKHETRKLAFIVLEQAVLDGGHVSGRVLVEIRATNLLSLEIGQIVRVQARNECTVQQGRWEVLDVLADSRWDNIDAANDEQLAVSLARNFKGLDLAGGASFLFTVANGEYGSVEKSLRDTKRAIALVD